MASGTFNIGKGGNINIGQATTGSLIKIDQNGLDTQVIISPQQGSTGTVLIGNNANSNRIGNLNIANNTANPNTAGQTINIGTANVTTANFATNATTTNINTTVGNTFIGSNTGTTQMSGIQNLIYNTTATRPAYLEMSSVPSNTGFSNNFLDCHVGGGGANVDYDVRMNVNAFNTTVAGTGSLRTSCGQEELLFSGNIPPRNLGTSFGLGLGHVSDVEIGSYIVGYKPYWTIQFGGCGDLNPIASSSVQFSMSVAPYYGMRLYTGGISFDKGDLTSSSGSGRGSFIQTGSYSSTTTRAAGSIGFVSITFPSAFGSVPTVIVTPALPSTAGIVTVFYYMSYGAGAITTTGMSVSIKNDYVASTAGSVYGFSYIAIGGY